MATPIRIARYGWRPDLPDQRDLRFRVTAPVRLPAKVSLRPKMPPPYDQGQLGSCTANAIAGAYEFVADRDVRPSPTPSRLFIYYFERYLEGSVNEDSGAMIRDGMKVINNWGAPPEEHWPYDINRFTLEPDQAAVIEAANHQATSYMRVKQTDRDVRTALVQGFPVVFGFTVYESFESQEVARTGIVPMPATSEQVLGGHAVLAVGYRTERDKSITFEVRNSWGTGWGDAGYFWMPGKFLLNTDLAGDFWTIKVTEG